MAGEACRQKALTSDKWHEGRGHIPADRTNGVRGGGIYLRGGMPPEGAHCRDQNLTPHPTVHRCLAHDQGFVAGVRRRRRAGHARGVAPGTFFGEFYEKKFANFFQFFTRIREPKRSAVKRLIEGLTGIEPGCAGPPVDVRLALLQPCRPRRRGWQRGERGPRRPGYPRQPGYPARLLLGEAALAGQNDLGAGGLRQRDRQPKYSAGRGGKVHSARLSGAPH
eukprot:1175577-Prorocentrum_minimum.AAC.2